jgi:hypothetical protein
MIVPFSLIVEGAPSLVSTSRIEGIIKDMWIVNDRCYFKIEITWSNSSWPDEKIIVGQVTYFNNETGFYESISSSQGWKIGDKINCTRFWQGDENSEWYWFETNSKSNDNFALPLEMKAKIPEFSLSLVIFSTLLITGLLFYLFYRVNTRILTIDRIKKI